MNVYLINRTYIAQDSATGLTAAASSEQTAIDRLAALLVDYWQTKRVIVSVTRHRGTGPKARQKPRPLPPRSSAKPDTNHA